MARKSARNRFARRKWKLRKLVFIFSSLPIHEPLRVLILPHHEILKKMAEAIFFSIGGGGRIRTFEGISPLTS